MTTSPVTPDDLQLAADFAASNPHIFPAGEASLKAQLRNRSTNGMIDAGAVVKRFNRLFIVVPNYLAWFTGQK